MEGSKKQDTPPVARKPATLDDILIGRILMGGVAFALTLLLMYVAHWVLVGLLGLGKLKAAVAVPVVVGWFLTSRIEPALPERGAIEDGKARVDPGMFGRYLRREIGTFVVAVAAGALALAYGSPMPTRSEVQSVHTGDKGTTLVFQQELTTPPPILSGLTITLAIVAFGTAFSAALGAHKAWQLREAVKVQEPIESPASVGNDGSAGNDGSTGSTGSTGDKGA